MSEAPAPIGHNNPPFAVQLAERQAGLKIRTDAILAEVSACPAKVETEAQHEAVATTMKAIADLLKEVEETHKAEKEPYKEKVDAIDAFFLSKGLKGLLEPAGRKLSLLNGAYQAALAEARRKEQERLAKEAAEAAAKKVQESADLEQQGRHTEAAVRMEGALAQEQIAAQADHRASASTTELGRQYSAAGTSSLAVAAKVIVDPDKVDLEKLRPFLAVGALEAAVASMARAKGFKQADLLAGKMPITGVTFEPEHKSRVR